MKKSFLVAIFCLQLLSVKAADIYIVDANNVTVWNSPQTINGNVYVWADATLKITTQILFKSGKGIIVKPGGRLELIGATLDGADGPVSPYLWNGVEVQGYENVGQPAPYFVTNGSYAGVNDNCGSMNCQGVLVMTSSILRNSKYGVTVGERDASGGIVSGSGGGIIKASNSMFDQNGANSIYFSPYPYRSVSSIENSFFHYFGTDASVPQFNGFNSHILLYRVNGVIIKDNTSIITSNSSGGSSFVLSSSASYIAQNNSISGGSSFSYGFANFGFSFLGYTTKIQGNTINVKHAGVLGFGTDHLTIVENEFADEAVDGSVVLLGCSGYVVEENTISGDRGVVVSHTGVLGNEIYKNNLENIQIAGIQAERDNRGVQLRCNQFNLDSGFDIVVTSNPGIPNQGKFSGSHQRKAAKNTFSHYCGSTTSDFHQNPGVSHTLYIHEGTPSEIPQCKSSSVINGSATISSNCPSHLTNDYIISLPEKVLDYSNFIIANGGTGSNGTGIGASNYSEEMFTDANPELNDIRSALMERSVAYSRYISALKDSGNIEGAIEYLMEENNEDARMLLIPILIGEGKYNSEMGGFPNAQSELDKLQGSIPEITEYIEWYQFIIDRFVVGEGNFETLEGEDLAFVQDLASSSSRMAYKARAILIHPNYGYEYAFSFEEILQHQSSHANVSNEGVRVYPNPAGSVVTVELLSSYGPNAQLRAVRLDGKVAYVANLDLSELNTAEIDVSDWVNGVYVVEITGNTGVMYHHKLIVE